MKAMDAIKIEQPDVDFDLVVPRVRIIHNPHACISLRHDVFDGPHDQQFLSNLASLRGESWKDRMLIDRSCRIGCEIL